MSVSRLSCLFLGLAPLATAQNDYYVDGLTGLDTPQRGTTAQTPWKTLHYAYARIPPAVFPDSHTLHVAGGQSYAPATNGEQYPLTPPANVATVGSGRPILDLPAGQTGYALDPATVYNRDQARIEGLVLRGGNIAIELGGAASTRHRPAILTCEFSGQNTAAIHIRTSAVNIDDPRVFQCRFRSQSRGLWGEAAGNAAILRPDVQECSFDGHADAGVVIEDRSGTGSDVGGVVHDCWFQQCPRGVLLYSGMNVQGTRLEIQSCWFKDSAVAGVDIQVSRPADPLVTIAGCGFVGGARGVRVAGTLAPGQYTVEVRGNYARGQTTAGFEFALAGSGTATLHSRGNLVERGATGFSLQLPTNLLQLSFSSLGDRALHCSGNGFVASGSSTAAQVALHCGIFADNQNGVSITGPLQWSLRFLTLADNRGVGLLASALGAAPALDHLVCADNVQAEVAVPAGTAIQWSAFANQSVPGTGNLQVDPRLQRPFYNLRAGSPCIDAGDPNASAPATDYEGDPRVLPGSGTGPGRADLGADEFVASGSAHAFGVAGFGSAAFHPELATPDPSVRIGQPFRVEVRGAADIAGYPADGAVILASAREDAGLLPADLSGIGAPGSFLFQDLRAVLALPPVLPAGIASATVLVPAEPGLVGVSVVLQALLTKPGTNAAGVVATQALRVTVGQ